MALLLILFALLSFVFLGTGSGSSSTSSPTGVTSRSCTSVVTQDNGKTVRRHSCSSSSNGSASVHSRVVVRCSARMSVGGKTSTRCKPPANP